MSFKFVGFGACASVGGRGISVRVGVRVIVRIRVCVLVRIPQNPFCTVRHAHVEAATYL